MRFPTSVRAALAFFGLAAMAAPAFATFHLMQIEQVIGGLNGDTSVQAIQLRMRTSFQNQVSNSRVRAWDAAGLNPVLVIDMTTNVANSATGDRVLIASSNFAMHTTPAAAPDFIMTNLIPASYLAAGSLTFEDDFGTILWRISWGGAGYTGSNLGSITNDADGNFGPQLAIALPSTTLQAVLFSGTATAVSTNNAAQYGVTSGAAVFTNNARAAFTVTAPAPGCPNNQPGCDRSDIFPAGGDCVVDLSDLGVVLSNFQPGVGGKTRSQGDIFPLGGGDGFVDLSDLGQILSDFNTDCR